jgi:puromycin-sensitive aminopeptidase
LDAADRLGIQADAYALAKAGHIPATQFLSVAQAYANESDPSVCGDLAANLNSLDNLLADEGFHPRFQAFARAIFLPIGGRIGWDARPGEGHRDTLLRSTALQELGHFEDEGTLAEARRRFDAYVDDPSSLHPDTRAVAFGMAAQRGDGTLYDLMWELEGSATLHEEKIRFLHALSSYRQGDLLQQTLDRSLTSDVRSQDTVRVVVSVASNRHGRDLAWEFLKDNWDEFARRYGEGGFGLMRLVGMTAMFTTEEQRQDVERFFADHSAPAAERTLRQSLERVRLNVAWLERNREELDGWLAG